MEIAGSSAPVARPYYRHRLLVRITHWINAVSLAILFMSGLGIFNAHPSLYWGDSSYNGRPALLEISAIDDPAPRGQLRVFGHTFDTTGVLGLSSANGQPRRRAFPSWLTVPGPYSLAAARLWHFFFAWLLVINGLLYLVNAIVTGHLKRDLAPDAQEMRGIGASIREHVRFKHPEGAAAMRYNVLQKLAYLIVIFILLPLIVLMGMAMSPMLDTVLGGWVDWFGGRQSARTIHFIVAWLLFGFVLIHLFEVLISGAWNQLRSMITGYYFVKPESKKGTQP
ncbi:MAG TPA: hypothetical protein DCW29_08330 [Janthinobacterium sp.]|nr:hypothetical protein [Janthinobacterium sp.]